jgi:hypothetical protein
MKGIAPVMKDATKRSIVRWIHIVFSIPILGYIYSPFEEIPKYAARVRFVVVPVNAPFGTLDVERPCPSTTYFEEIGLTRRCSEPLPARLKEWAYAGFAINLASALSAHLSVGDGPDAWGWEAATGVLWGVSYFFWRRLQATPASA